MIISKKLLALLVVVTGISSVILINRTIESPALQTMEANEATQTQNHHQQQKTATTELKAFSALPAEKDNTPITTRDVLKTDIPYNPLQDTKIIELINSPQKDERGAAIQQLGAYPNQASETLLTQLLTTDQEPSVRNAAARSLGIIYKPTEPTLEALLNALEDESEAVRFTALTTLENYLLREDSYSEKATALKSALETKILSNAVSNTVKEAIQKVLQMG